MSVYVGIDVHRKRSQVAVVTEDGQVQLNKNVVNGSEPMLRLIGDLPSGTPVAFEAAFGWGWLAGLLEDYGFEAHLESHRGARRRHSTGATHTFMPFCSPEEHVGVPRPDRPTGAPAAWGPCFTQYRNSRVRRSGAQRVQLVRRSSLPTLFTGRIRAR